MKRFSPIQTVTCKCDVCRNESDFSYDKDTHYYESLSGMVVCSACKDDFNKSAKIYGSEVNWHGVPENRLDYDVQEYERDEDYLND